MVRVWLVCLVGFVLLGGCTPKKVVKKKGPRTYEQLVQDLRRGSVEKRLSALEEFEQKPEYASKRQAFRAVRRLAEHDDPRIRRGTVHVFKLLEPKRGMSLLFWLAKDKDKKVREEAKDALVSMASSWMTNYREELGSFSQERRVQVAEVLGRIGPRARPAVPELVKMLQREKVDDKEAAAKALGSIGPAPGVVKALQKAFSGSKMWWKLRVQIARAIGRMGKYGLEALPTLVAALSDKDDHVKRAVIRAFVDLGPVALPTMEKMLKEKEWQKRWIAARLFGMMGAKAVPSIPAILAAFEDSDATVQKAAMTSIGKLEKDTPPVLNALKGVVYRKENGKSVKHMAIQILIKLGPSGIKTLLLMYKDKKVPERDVIAYRLKGAGLDVNSKQSAELIKLFQKIPSSKK